MTFYVTPPKQKKKRIHNGKTNVGRLVFISLICISVAITALALGITFSRSDAIVGNSATSSTEGTAEETQRVPVSVNGATPELQDSPLVFEEYDGDGSMTPQQIYDYVKAWNSLIWSVDQTLVHNPTTTMLFFMIKTNKSFIKNLFIA